jgi:hypothetical protein
LNNTLVGLVGGEKIGDAHRPADVHGIGGGYRIDAHVAADKYVPTDIQGIIRRRFADSDIT